MIGNPNKIFWLLHPVDLSFTEIPKCLVSVIYIYIYILIITRFAWDGRTMTENTLIKTIFDLCALNRRNQIKRTYYYYCYSFNRVMYETRSTLLYISKLCYCAQQERGDEKSKNI
jgi:hypothetical protein